jgi:hypothetical protein
LAIQRPEEFVLRKLVAAIAFLAVAVLPATALGQPHWYRGEETQVTVYVERTRVDATNWSSIKRAGAQWARSSRIRVVYVIPEGAETVNPYEEDRLGVVCHSLCNRRAAVSPPTGSGWSARSAARTNDLGAVKG